MGAGLGTRGEEMLTQATDAELTAAVSANLYTLFRAMVVLPGYEPVEHAGLSGHSTPLSNPMFRGVWAARLQSSQVETAIDAAIAWFGQRRTQDFLWWIDGQTEPYDLAARLLARGFDGNLDGDPGMALDLDSLRQSRPEGLTVMRASTERQLQDWQDVFTLAFAEPSATGQAWVNATVQAGGAAAPWRLYVGYLGGRPVATSLVFPGAGVVGVYAVGTLPEVRRKGIGASITAASLLDAQARGYRYAVLFATRSGQSVYQRVGFHAVAGAVGVYLYEPPGGQS